MRALCCALVACSGIALAAPATQPAAAPATRPAAAPATRPAPASQPAAQDRRPASRRLTFEPHVLVDVTFAPLPDDAPDVASPLDQHGDDRFAVARLRRAYLGASGRLPGPFAYRLTFAAWDGAALDDGALRTAGPRLLDTWVALNPGPWLTLAIGELPVGLMRARLEDEAEQPLFERPRFVDRLTPDRRLGGAAWGNLGLLLYRVGAYRAVPTWPVGDATWPWGGALLTGRLELEPLGPLRVAGPRDPWWSHARVALGAAALYETGGDRTRLALAGDVVFAWRHLRLKGEVLFARTTADSAVRQSFGFFVEGTWRVWRLVEVEARHEWSDGTTRVDPFLADYPHEWATTVGAALLLAEDHVRLGAAYVHRESTLPSGPSGKADALLLGVRGRY